MLFNIIKINNNIRIKLLKNNKLLGESSSQIHSDKINSSLNNIYINNNFKHNGYGSKLLNKTESILKELKIEKVYMTVWSPDTDDSLCSFYEKNNYKLTTNQPVINKIDNYDKIYLLYNMYKKL